MLNLKHFERKIIPIYFEIVFEEVNLIQFLIKFILNSTNSMNFINFSFSFGFI